MFSAFRSNFNFFPKNLYKKIRKALDKLYTWVYNTIKENNKPPDNERMISMTATKTFIINDEPVEMTKEECYAKFSELYNKGAERMALLEALMKSARRIGNMEMLRKYRREYVDIKSDIDFFAMQHINWDK